MAKVRYPGPSVEGRARTQAQIHLATGLRLVPGEVFEVSEAVRVQLAGLVEVVPVEPPRPATEDGNWVERAEKRSKKVRRRRIFSDSEEGEEPNDSETATPDE